MSASNMLLTFETILIHADILEINTVCADQRQWLGIGILHTNVAWLSHILTDLHN